MWKYTDAAHMPTAAEATTALRVHLVTSFLVWVVMFDRVNLLINKRLFGQV